MKWITREQPKIDRIACPWLIKRFIDKEAQFLYVPKNEVLAVAQAQGAIPYDIAGVELTHEGELCSFDKFLSKYDLLGDAALVSLAKIVRAADTDTLENSPQAPGLLAITLGLSKNFTNDHEMLAIGMILYDALYSWCQSMQEQRHGWNPG
jgi:hypothetical protein